MAPAILRHPASFILITMHHHHSHYPQPVMPSVPVRRLLEGQSAIVTGASSGIGRAIAIELGAAGANVCVNFRSEPEKAKEVVAEIEGAGSHAYSVKADVASEAEIIEMFRGACEE